MASGIGKRRSIDDVEVSEMVLSPSVTVHGVCVGAVSPVRDSRTNSSVNILDWHFTDGKKVLSFACSFPF